MHRILLVALVLLTCSAAGCYYTVTESDGTTRKINHKEYEQLKKSEDTEIPFRY